MIDRDCYGQVSVCALGAMALRRALVERSDEDFDIIYDDILHGSMKTALGMGSFMDAQDISDRFDVFVATTILPIEHGKAGVFWHRAAAMFDDLATN
tara:strand:+ start:208 stop:498 length:291 start_codon:yes stop_codon:yes gene_type:complete